MKKILLISTGGTIASKPSADGLVPKLEADALLRLVPQIKTVCDAKCIELFSLDSSNIEPHHWTQIADAVVREYANYDGFVLTHGTDTMAYTCAALTWMLQGIQKPLVLTGAQLPIEDPSTDGKKNLLNAFCVATSEHSGVFLVFGDSVINGDCAKKLYTQKFEAFASINKPRAAHITHDGIIWAEDFFEKHEKNKLAFTPKTAVDEKVFVYKLSPGASESFIDFAMQNGYKAIVIEGFGAGGVPNGENCLLGALKRAIDAGVIVVCATQCIYDGVHLDVYDVGVKAKRLGVLSAGQMTTEAAVTKLMWALGNSDNASHAKQMFLK